jgi:preprotein translocase subunit SecA
MQRFPKQDNHLGFLMGGVTILGCECRPKPFNFAIVDEVDSVLIDEGRNPLLISSQSIKDAARYPVAAEVAALLLPDYHYKVDFKDKNVELTEEGVAAAELALETEDLWDEKDPWARFVMTALKAKEFHQRDVHYIVKDGQVQIVDEVWGLSCCVHLCGSPLYIERIP